MNRILASGSPLFSSRSQALLLCAGMACACHSNSREPQQQQQQDQPDSSPPTPDASIPDASTPDASTTNFCDLPGSVQFTDHGTVTVSGHDTSQLTFLQLPVGFCAHYFGNVPNARQLRFAPGGELFVASPTTATTGGGGGGKQAILVLPDDDGDGYADTSRTFLSNLPSTQGLLFTAGFFYYQDATKILRVPYHSGDRAPAAASAVVADIQIYSSSLHWPKALDQADDGTIYVGNGGDQAETCVEPHPFHGGVLKLDGTMAAAPVAQGFRNPIAIRCEHGKNLCFAAELARDYSAGMDGREKLVPIRAGDDWGFPCCATHASPFPDVTGANCSAVAPEDTSFLIGDTPFSFDFERGKWPAPYTGAAFVPLHGAAGTWHGARVVAVAIDPKTGLPVPGDDLDGGSSTRGLRDFAAGYDDEMHDHGRPAAVEFAEDGRLFLGNDNDGTILWIAPLGLPIPR
jgi:glucose/arabinose dehydrogenase